jgi:hypothetical protein
MICFAPILALHLTVLSNELTSLVTGGMEVKPMSMLRQY